MQNQFYGIRQKNAHLGALCASHYRLH